MEEKTGFFQRPLVRALMGFGGFVLAYFLMDLLVHLWVWLFSEEEGIILPVFFLDPVNNFWQQTIDAGICIFGLLAWLVFFAQFVLPVRTFSDRLKVVDRLLTYVTGGHGPAIFIENGIVRAREEEKERKGPGVIWLDSASAAVLRTNSRFTNTIGPGVHFSDAKERVAGTADLHSLTQVVGPLDSDQGECDPFKAAKENPDYESIQARRWETSALTRDGIEILATISVTHHIAAKENEGHSRFGFNQENAQRAIRDSITRGADTSQPVWSELPARMAVDVWREYVRKFRQDELFELIQGRSETALQLIGAMVTKRLKQAEVEQLDDFGRPELKSEEACQEVFNQHVRQNLYAELDSARLNEFFAAKDFSGLYTFLLQQKKGKEAEDFLKKLSSREYKTLSEMGLEVQGVSLKRVAFPPEIEERIIAQWTTLWKKNAEKERDQVERDRKLAEVAGQEEALKRYAVDATREFRFDPLPNKYEALFSLVRNIFLGVRRNSSLLKRINTEQRELSNIFSWLRDRGARG